VRQPTDRPLAAAIGSCGDGYALDPDELEYLSWRALHFETQVNGLANTHGDIIQGACLRMASWKLRD